MTKRVFPVVFYLFLLAARGPDCRAQFLDEFNGDALAPHWQVWPTPAYLDHTVDGGLLRVNDLPLPSNPKSLSNTGQIQTAFPPAFPPVAGDFLARAIVGWDPGSGRALQWHVSNTLSQLLGSMTYGDSGSISVQGGLTQPMVFPAPPPGFHEFAFTRQGNTMRAYLDGALLTSFIEPTGLPVAATGVSFAVVYPNLGFQPLYVDLVQVIPAPPTLVVFGAVLGFGIRRRR